MMRGTMEEDGRQANWRPRQRDRERDILEAATWCFHQQGYAATSIQAIANRAGLLKGSLYHYISSKEELLYRVIDEVHAQLFRNVDEVRAAKGRAYDRLSIFVDGHIRLLVNNLIGGRVFFTDFRHLSGNRRKKILAERDRYEGFVRALISQGQDEGSICPDINPRIAAASLLTLMNSICMWFDPEGPVEIDGLRNEYRQFSMRMLRCDPNEHWPGHRWGDYDRDQKWDTTVAKLEE